MIKKNPLAALSIVFIVAVMTVLMIIGIGTRRSYRNLLGDAAANPDTYLLHQTVDYKENEYKEIRRELLDADIIVMATPVGKEQYLYQSTKVQLQIQEVIKGNITVGSVIDYYEPNFFGFMKSGDIVYYNISLFNLMQEGVQYIVFANKCNYHPAYQNALEKEVYREANLQVSYFQKDMTKPPVLSNGTIYYADIKNNEFNCCSSEQRDNINKFKTELIEEIRKGSF